MPRMNREQRALAAEVRAEMGAQNAKASHIQEALGVSSTAWGTWFVQCTRDVPMSAVYGVANYLGLTPDELMRRAAVRMAAMPEDDPLTPRTAAGKAAVEAGRKALAKEKKPTRRGIRKRTG
jgi:hypothetical protein